MARKKLKQMYIANESARKATFKKRKWGLMKKVRELSTLCDIQACAIVNNPFDETQPPETWPPTVAGVHQVLTRFKEMPMVDQVRDMVNQKKFLDHRIKKAANEGKKYDDENSQKEVDLMVIHCLAGRMDLQGLPMSDFELISRTIERKIKEVDECLAKLSRIDGGGNVLVAPQVAGDHGGGGGNQEEYVDGMKRQQLLTEAMMNDPAAATVGVDDEWMTMSMMMDQRAGTSGMDVGESSSNVETLSTSNTIPTWNSSDPFFGWDF